MDLKTIFGLVETILGGLLLIVSIMSFYFAFTFSGPILNFVEIAIDSENIIILADSLIMLLKIILYSFDLFFLFASILLILDGILKIRDED